ncbi:MAG: hypothetical protein QOJ35_1885 [Solirubrobacteraceae bacterium]|jgi:hypothetical protein|nr:hypothetical protein [Solirubrobacteraceae bacterium]
MSSSMRTRSIQPGDIVLCDKRGRLFHARVIGARAGGGLTVQPIERGISYRQVAAADISDHWAHAVSTRREDRRPSAQTAMDL